VTKWRTGERKGRRRGKEGTDEAKGSNWLKFEAIGSFIQAIGSEIQAKGTKRCTYRYR